MFNAGEPIIETPVTPEPEIVPETGEVVEESTKKRGRKKGGNTESMDALFFDGKEE